MPVSEVGNKGWGGCLEEEAVLKEKMEALGRLARKVAHDLNNIVTIIKGNADILQMTAGKESPFGKYVGAILAAGKRASDLAAQLSCLNEKRILRPAPVDLNGLLRGMESRIRETLHQGVELIIEQTASPLLFLGDRGGVEEIIMNLVKNACSAMPQGGRLTIKAQADSGLCPAGCRADKGGEWVVLSVKDTGCGISEEIRGKIFEPFFTSKPKGEADGLGLSRVYGLVKASGGFIRFDSRPGEGVCFFVGFPAAGNEGDMEAA
jgi:signal transduction histidine kinase